MIAFYGTAHKRTYRRMSRLMIDMYEGSLDIGEYLDSVLKLLTNIVCFPQGRVGIHNDVDLDKIVLVVVLDS